MAEAVDRTCITPTSLHDRTVKLEAGNLRCQKGSRGIEGVERTNNPGPLIRGTTICLWIIKYGLFHGIRIEIGDVVECRHVAVEHSRNPVDYDQHPCAVPGVPPEAG